MTDEELKQLIAANAQGLQALSRDVAQLVATQQQAAKERQELSGELRALSRDVAQLVATQQESVKEAAIERQELRQAIIRLTQVQEGMANWLYSVDEDRPTILRKLTSIEHKVDRILDQNQGEQS